MLPPTLLGYVSWTFREEPYSDRSAFNEAVRTAQNPEWNGAAWQPARIVLNCPRVRIRLDTLWYPADVYPFMEFAADNGAAFTEGELLFKVHNTWAVELRQTDHKDFLGFSLAEQQEPGAPPLYTLDLGRC